MSVQLVGPYRVTLLGWQTPVPYFFVCAGSVTLTQRVGFTVAHARRRAERAARDRADYVWEMNEVVRAGTTTLVDDGDPFARTWGGEQTFEDFTAKVEWEGGVWDAIAYGLTSDDLTPEAREANPEFVQAWDAAVAAVKAAELACWAVEALLPEA